MNFFSLIFFTGTFLFLQACDKDDDEQNCSGAICTEEFRTIVVSIEDAETNPVALDSFRVIHLESRDDLTRDISEWEFENMQKNASYPLFGDEHLDAYKNQELEINFTGYIDDEEIVSSDYIVGVDCCHVYHISGDLEIEID